MLQKIDQDVRFANIGNLPSNFFPYKNEFKALNIRQFTVGDLKLLSRATTTKDVAMTAKAIDMTIDVPVDRLTIGDFYYVLMWHKLHSFPKTPLTVRWECLHNIPVDKEGIIVANEKTLKELADLQGPDYVPVKQVVDHLEVCKHANAQIINQSNVDIVSLEDDFAGIPEAFDYPRVALLPEIYEMRNDPDYTLLLAGAQWIKTGNTLKEKFEYLESLPDISVFEEAETLNETVIHGVNEYITLKCDRCSNTFTKKLELDPLNFFRPGL